MVRSSVFLEVNVCYEACGTKKGGRSAQDDGTIEERVHPDRLRKMASKEAVRSLFGCSFRRWMESLAWSCCAGLAFCNVFCLAFGA